MAQEESERVLAEARAIVQKRAERALEREKPKKPVVAAKPKPKAKVKAAKKPKPVVARHGHGKAQPKVAKKKK